MVRDAAEKPYTTMIAQTVAGIATYTPEQLAAAARIEYGFLDHVDVSVKVESDLTEARKDQELVDAIKTAEREYAQYDRLYDEVCKPIMKARREALAEIADLKGLGHHFQDDDGLVYFLSDKTGTFVDFTPFEMKRTQRTYGEGGNLVLARKTAEQLGYENIFKPTKAEAIEE
jgi:hypothetical protein